MTLHDIPDRLRDDNRRAAAFFDIGSVKRLKSRYLHNSAGIHRSAVVKRAVPASDIARFSFRYCLFQALIWAVSEPGIGSLRTRFGLYRFSALPLPVPNKLLSLELYNIC